MDTQSFATVNPSTGEEIETFSFYDSARTENTLVLASKSFESFRNLSVYKRAQFFSKLAETFRKNKAQLAKVITIEMGKIIAEAEAEIEKCAHEADWYAEHGPRIMADEPAPTARDFMNCSQLTFPMIRPHSWRVRRGSTLETISQP
jgi:acyl-CoA reductase-like NAD-dependent aldehyde dehydrogenase